MYVSPTDQFYGLMDKLEESTKCYSSCNQIMEHKDYLEIIKFSYDHKALVIKLLIEEIEEKPNVVWLLLLGDITKKNPVPKRDAGKINRMAWWWIKWYKLNRKKVNSYEK